MSDKTYQELAEQALWKAEKSIGTSIEGRSLFLQEAQVYATLHLAEVNAKTDNKTAPNRIMKCDHWVTVKRSGHYGYASDTSPDYWTHTYCPKCGVKL